MRYRGEWGFRFGITPAVKYLILGNAGIFILSFMFSLLGLNLSSFLGLTPVMFWRGAIWQPLTYMFLHGGIFHLLLNMLVLWMFGSTLESAWGPRKFLKFYLICGTGAGLMNAVVLAGSPVPTVGASGGIYGLLMAFAILVLHLDVLGFAVGMSSLFAGIFLAMIHIAFAPAAQTRAPGSAT